MVVIGFHGFHKFNVKTRPVSLVLVYFFVVRRDLDSRATDPEYAEILKQTLSPAH